MIAVAIVGGIAGVITACGDMGCGNVVRSDAQSPDARRHAVVFTRACGATTGYSTHVAVLASTDSPSGAGNALIVDDNHGAAPSVGGQGPTVIATWLNAQTLELHYDSRDRVFRQSPSVSGVAIRYAAHDSTLSSP